MLVVNCESDQHNIALEPRLSIVLINQTKTKTPELKEVKMIMAGTVGFEPTNAGTKNQCLTTWRRPIVRMQLCGYYLADKINLLGKIINPTKLLPLNFEILLLKLVKTNDITNRLILA